MSSKHAFFAQLQRRNVHRALVFYAGAAWLLVQVATQVFPFFHVDESVVRWIVIAAVVGFPFAMLFSWFYEWTPQGIKRESEIDRSQSATQQTGKTFDRAIIAVLSLAVVLLLTDKFVLRKTVPNSAKAPTGKSIAVLPFENLSADPGNAYFADGIQDEILTRLAKIGALKVISRTSTQQYAAHPGNLKEIARQLGVENILEGSVQKVGGSVHVTVQLIRAAADEHLWAESYTRKLDDVFAVEGEVAQTVAETLHAKLSGTESAQLAIRPTSNVAAYEAYLRGLAFENRTDLQMSNIPRSIEAYAQAVDLDPGFALAWAHLSRQHSYYFLNLGEAGGQREAARAALDTAIRLAPELVETQIADGYFQYWILRDYEGAKQRFQIVRERAPNNTAPISALAAIASRQGQWTLSRQLFEEALGLNPLDVALLTQMMRTEITMRDFEAASRAADRIDELSPGNAPSIFFRILIQQLEGRIVQSQSLIDSSMPLSSSADFAPVIVLQALLTRQYANAISVLQEALEKPQDPSSPPSDVEQFELWLGDMQRLSNNPAVAAAHYRKALSLLEGKLGASPDNAELFNQRALVYAGLGDEAAALTDVHHAIALFPASKDAGFGPDYEDTLARIQSRFGDKDNAIPALQHLLSIPYAYVLTRARLRLEPDFDKLREDSRFQALIAGDDASDALPRARQ